MTPITRADLPLSPLPGTCLHCPACGETYSANPADYWQMPDGEVFICGAVAHWPKELARVAELYALTFRGAQ